VGAIVPVMRQRDKNPPHIRPIVKTTLVRQQSIPVDVRKNPSNSCFRAQRDEWGDPCPGFLRR
jgi:hypothetical protein